MRFFWGLAAVGLVAAPAAFGQQLSITGVDPLTPEEQVELRAQAGGQNLDFSDARTFSLDAESLASAERVAISLDPFLTLQIDRTSRGEDNLWRGEVNDVSIAAGASPHAEATLSTVGGRIFGVVRSEMGTYRVMPLASGQYALVKFAHDAFPPDGPERVTADDRTNNQDANPASPSIEKQVDPGAVEISLLVIVTQEAAAKTPDVSAFVDVMIAETNSSFSRSLAPIALNLVGKVVIEKPQPSKDHDALLAWFTKGDFGQSIAALRAEARADIVMVLVDAPSLCGQAMQVAARWDTAFATVHVDCAIDNLSFAHELGHLLGACHDSTGSTACQPYPFGRGYQRPKIGARTIMATQCSERPCTRMARWAVPPDWGTEEDHHDAKAITHHARLVSQFYE